MAEATLPLPARVHAALARTLDWVWPRGAAWAYADAPRKPLAAPARVPVRRPVRPRKPGEAA